MVLFLLLPRDEFQNAAIQQLTRVRGLELWLCT